ncbi:MAG: hypothetical protein K2N63_15570 [Lachnospiraceae bacterium]|nr:hypothetical protein [Lachnospiraceae bacterium]
MRIAWKKAICYSGYREGQSPVTGIVPTKEEILEDLLLLKKEGFSYLRMYDPNAHARQVLELIREYCLPFLVMVGIDPRAEYNNKGCPWLKSEKTTLELEENMVYNDDQIKMLTMLANEYKEYFIAVSIGNENRPSWGADLVTEERLIGFAEALREGTGLPVTYCEGAGEWKNLERLAEKLDFISIHSYPLWNGKTLEEAVRMNQDDYHSVASLYPDKQVIFTECGWTTECNASMDAAQVGEKQQEKYLAKLLFWAKSEKIPVFVFEAFDEPWKGGKSPQEPEKHWGIFDVDRKGKQVVRNGVLG